MTRTIISLDKKDKSWLDRKSAETGLPMSEIVRQAIRRMQGKEEAAFDRLLKRTSGIWRHGDGLVYQRRMRKEWR
jgi:hypothetical protein